MLISTSLSAYMENWLVLHVGDIIWTSELERNVKTRETKNATFSLSKGKLQITFYSLKILLLLHWINIAFLKCHVNANKKK